MYTSDTQYTHVPRVLSFIQLVGLLMISCVACTLVARLAGLSWLPSIGVGYVCGTLAAIVLVGLILMLSAARRVARDRFSGPSAEDIASGHVVPFRSGAHDRAVARTNRPGETESQVAAVRVSEPVTLYPLSQHAHR
jgi:hypothetical protein